MPLKGSGAKRYKVGTSYLRKGRGSKFRTSEQPRPDASSGLAQGPWSSSSSSTLRIRILGSGRRGGGGAGGRRRRRQTPTTPAIAAAVRIPPRKLPATPPRKSSIVLSILAHSRLPLPWTSLGRSCSAPRELFQGINERPFLGEVMLWRPAGGPNLPRLPAREGLNPNPLARRTYRKIGILRYIGGGENHTLPLVSGNQEGDSSIYREVLTRGEARGRVAPLAPRAARAAGFARVPRPAVDDQQPVGRTRRDEGGPLAPTRALTPTMSPPAKRRDNWIQLLHDARKLLEDALARHDLGYAAMAKSRLQSIWEELAAQAQAGEASLKESLAEIRLAGEDPEELIEEAICGPITTETWMKVLSARDAVLKMASRVEGAGAPGPGGEGEEAPR